MRGKKKAPAKAPKAKAAPKAARSPFGKFGDIEKGLYLQALRDGNGRMAAARAAGVSNELVRLYRHEHPEFVDEEDGAQREATERVENALFTSALEGNVTAQQVWLYNRAPDRWKDQRNLKLIASDDDINRAIEAELERLSGPGETADAGPAPQEANGHAG